MANGYGGSSSSSASRTQTTSQPSVVVQQTEQQTPRQPVQQTAQQTPQNTGQRSFSTPQQPSLVVKSISANNTFNIQQKVIKLPFKKNTVELTIFPKKSRMINAEDFNVGRLPTHVDSVSFSNLGENVVAIVSINKEINSPKTVTINIPIYGKSTIKQDTFTIIETQDIFGDILTNDLSPFPKSVVNNKTMYAVKNDLGKKRLVLSKTFAVTDKFKFSKGPTYTITGNATRYKVVTEFKKNKRKEVISKTFKFYYTSPSIMTSSQDTKISFFARANDISPQVSELVATSVKENKIYSINQGIDPGPLGGMKRLVVRGVPGSTFKFIASNSNGEMYDVNLGTFSGTGGFISGTIPPTINGKSYGEYVIRINVPRTGVIETISTQVLKDEDPAILKSKIEQAVAISAATGEDISSTIKEAQGKNLDIVKQIESLTVPTLTFTVTLGDFLGPKVNVDVAGVTTTTQQIFLGKEGRETLKITKPGEYRFACSVSSTGRVQLVRQPLFVMPEEAGVDNFHTDGGTPSTAQKLAKLGSDGSTAIVSDWDFTTVQEKSDIQIKMDARGVGKSLSSETVSGTALLSFGSVIVRGSIFVKNIGRKSDTIALKLDNFLARKDV